MREILFRGKRTDNGEWVKGFYSFEGYANKHYISAWYYGSYAELQQFEVDAETVGQFTGLTDENGKKIFEGDIVMFKGRGYIPTTDCGKVIFKHGCYAIEYRKKGRDGCLFCRIGKVDRWQDMGASGTITYTYEVIGNIHDNPELLEDTK